MVSIELTAPTINKLVEFGLLAETARLDRGAVRAGFLIFARQALDQAATVLE
jgi:hypothetical protein